MKRKLGSLLLSLIIFLGSTGILYYNQIYNNKITLKKDFRVEKGETLYGVLDKLGIERNIFLRVHMKLKGKNAFKVEVGNYSFNGDYTIVKILEQLKKGRDDFIKVTIPEGFTLNKIAIRLEENSVISRDELYDAISKVEDFYYPTPNGNFEGYFFPDTYYFGQNESGKSVLKRFLDRFLEKFPPEQFVDKDSFYNKLILASIIEKEAGAKDEMELVASVFHNRIRDNMRLQSCATIAYLFDYEKDFITYKDLQIKSEYNTYRKNGLPPTPIANPGEEAIKASYSPIETNYFYFVLQENGKHHFSTTYDEHLKAQRREGTEYGSVKIRVNR